MKEWQNTEIHKAIRLADFDKTNVAHRVAVLQLIKALDNLYSAEVLEKVWSDFNDGNVQEYVGGANADKNE